MSQEALQRAIDEAGRLMPDRGAQAALAELLSVTPMAITNWKHRGVPHKQAIAIEKALSEKVLREELRPDIFSRTSEAA